MSIKTAAVVAAVTAGSFAGVNHVADKIDSVAASNPAASQAFVGGGACAMAATVGSAVAIVTKKRD